MPIRGLLGAAFGALVAAVVAVNIAIFGGAEDGYETGLVDLVRSDPLLAVVVLSVLVLGPIIGAVLALRSNRPSVTSTRRSGDPAANSLRDTHAAPR